MTDKLCKIKMGSDAVLVAAAEIKWDDAPDDAEPTSIQKTFTFKNFQHAIIFITAIAVIAEEQDHHPDIYLFKYKNVDIKLQSHACKGVSLADFNIAKEIEITYQGIANYIK